MIIVSQDKKKITDNMNLYIDNVYPYSLDEPRYSIENDNCRLGQYLTEERAKEVLQEIIDTYTRKILINNNTKQQPILDDLVYRVPIDSNIQYIDTNIVYEMPKE